MAWFHLFSLYPLIHGLLPLLLYSLHSPSFSLAKSSLNPSFLAASTMSAYSGSYPRVIFTHILATSKITTPSIQISRSFFRVNPTASATSGCFARKNQHGYQLSPIYLIFTFKSFSHLPCLYSSLYNALIIWPLAHIRPIAYVFYLTPHIFYKKSFSLKLSPPHSCTLDVYFLVTSQTYAKVLAIFSRIFLV